MLTVECAVCGKSFGAQRSTAKFCSTKCRVAATRARARQQAAAELVAPHVIPMRQDGARLIAVAPSSQSEEGFVATTRRQLNEAGRLNSYQGVAAMFAAQVLDSGSQDTMSSMAAMIRTYQAAMRDALEGAAEAADPLEQLLERRGRRSA
jgi:predicted nucleic acid-binding Zn ribbon protein